VFCRLVVLLRLSVPVQVIDWKDLSYSSSCHVTIILCSNQIQNGDTLVPA